MPNLVSVKVTGLLGRFDHELEFPAQDEFIIIHGPNGIGKTKLLELISGTLSGNAFRLVTIPFRHAKFDFDDGAQLTVKPSPRRTQDDVETETSEFPTNGVEFTLRDHEGAVTTVRGPVLGPRQMTQLRTLIDHELPVHRLAGDTWLDPATNSRLSTYEVINLYNNQLDARGLHLFTSAWLAQGPVADFIGQLSVHFIETQRLLIDSQRSPTQRYPEGTAVRARVLKLADDLKNSLRDALAQNSRTSQQLDRDFPRRIMLERTDLPAASEESIQKKYAEQTQLRQALAENALLDMPGDLPLPQRHLDDWERRFLWTYLLDTEKKLETFIPILEKTKLLAEIVNSRFLYKTLRIDSELGFKFITDDGAEIQPQLLSSGEQHELVLAYELLFQAKRNSLVLIDEPEISLHIAWQREFLNDIIRIAHVSSLRFIIATHSPQIINKYWNRTTALHPDFDESSADDA